MNKKRLIVLILCLSGYIFCHYPCFADSPSRSAMAEHGAGAETKPEKAQAPLDVIEILAQTTDFVNEVQVNFTRLMKAKKIPGIFDENSVKVTETDKDGKEIKNVKCNFIKHVNFNKENFAAGRVLFCVARSEQKTGGPASRYYRIGFDAEGKEPGKPAYDPGLREANLINLGGFEETDNLLYSKEGWVIGPGGEITEKTAHSGKRSLKMRVLPENKNKICSTTSPFCQVRPKEQYNILLWGKAIDALGGSYVLHCTCHFYDQKGQNLGNSNKITVAHSKDSFFEWTKTEKVVEAPEGASSLRLFISARAKDGNVYIDDVSITPFLKTGLNQKDSKLLTEKMYPCLDYYFDISDKYETPHFNWMKPSAGGKIKVLYADYMQYVSATTKRQVIEFAQRMDLDYKFIPLLKRMKTPSRGNLGMNGSDTYADDLEQYIVDRLSEEVIKDYTVMVVQGLDFKGVQKEVMEMLIEEVKKGKGLVLLDCNNLPPQLGQILTDGKVDVPPSMLIVPQVRYEKKTKKQPACRLAVLEKGRIASLASPKLDVMYPNYCGREIPSWEYMHLPAMKAIAWASCSKNEITVDKFAYQDGSLKAEINCAGPLDAFFETTYRDEYNQVNVLDKKDLKLKTGRNEVSLKIPSLPGGLHLADYRLMNKDGKVFDFGSVSFATPFSAEIKEITFDRECYRTGEEIKAGAALSNITANCKLVCEVEDTHNRRIKRLETTLAEGQTGAAVSFKLENPLTILHRLFVRVEKEGKVLAQKMGEFSMPFNYPPDDELMAYVWYGQPRGLKVWADNGFDCLVADFKRAGSSGILKALCNMNLRPYGYGAGHLLGNLGSKYEGDGGDDLVREPCLSDPERWKKTTEKCQEIIKNDRHLYYGIRDYQLTDEMSLGAKVCFSPYCLAGFRTYLKEQYKSLEALNAEWRSDFKTWDEVKPVTLAEVKEEKGNLPQWLDHRLFMNLVFARWIAKNKEITRELNPGAKMGLSGTQNPGNTFDWWAVMKYMDCIGNYGQSDLINSFQLPGTRSGQWTGGYAATEKDYEKYEKNFPWDGVFGGNTAYMFFHGSSGGTTLLGDLRFTTNGQYMVEELKELKSGTAKMLFSSERLTDGIGVHYSQSSLFAASATIGKEYWSGALSSWKYMISDLGLSFKYIAYEQLEKEGIDNAKYKLFILPVSLALSAKEIEHLRDYVAKGGVLLADGMPGLYDEHGKKGDNRALAELFGIDRVKGDKVVIGECQLSVKADPADNLKERKLTVRYGEEGIKLTTGKAFGDCGKPDVPMIVVNRFGKGKTILLNCLFGDYAQVTLGGEGGETSEMKRGNAKITTPLRELIADIFSGCKVERSVSISTTDGRDFQPFCRTIRYKNGALQYVGILKQMNNNYKVLASDYVPVNISLNQEGHIYDVRAGKYIGKGSKVTTSIAPAIARLYAILPYAVKAIELKSGIAGQLGATIKIPVKIVANEGKTGDHVIHVEVIGPDDQPRKYYSQNIILKDGEGNIIIPTGLNDQAGEWQVKVKDVASGIQATTSLHLK